MDDMLLLDSLRKIVREEIEANIVQIRKEIRVNNDVLVARFDEKLRANNVAVGELLTQALEDSRKAPPDNVYRLVPVGK